MLTFMQERLYYTILYLEGTSCDNTASVLLYYLKQTNIPC